MPSHSRTTRDTSSSSTSATSGSAGTQQDAYDLYGNQAIKGLMDQGLSYDTAVQKNAKRLNQNGIVHVGMNQHAHDEVNALSGMNNDRGGVRSIRQRGEEQDTLTKGGVKYDFNKEEDARAYVATLGMPADKAKAAADQLLATGGNARDEVAQILEVYWQAERGDRDMQRMVLSGHSVGSMIWGDDNGTIDFAFFKEMAKLFPRAAGQVKHLMVSACYAGGEANMLQYQEMFPNIESIWGYHSSSPGTWSGAIPHMDRWEKATEDGDPRELDPSLAKNTRKAENVSTWTAKGGYKGDEPMGLYDIERALEEQSTTWMAHYQGDVAVENAQAGPLRTYYNLIQRYLQNPEAGDVGTYQVRRDQVIRLLFWNVITPKFKAAYGGKLGPALEKAGLGNPDLSKMTRKQAMDLFEAFEDKYDRNDSAQQEAFELMNEGLIQLKERFVPTNWV